MLKKVSKKFGGLEKGFYLCTVLEIRHDSGCSAVGSVQRSGRWGRQFESGHSDKTTQVVLEKTAEEFQRSFFVPLRLTHHI